MKPTVFYFDFYNEDTDELVSKGFNINADVGGEEFIYGDEYEDIAQNIESEYGVHDWYTSPSDEVFGIGYTTYEVAPELIDRVMADWRQEFVDLVGESAVTAVVTLSDITANSDYEIYREVQALTQ